MINAIVIGSYVGSKWLAECVDSLPQDIDVIVVCEPFYEAGTIGWIHRHTNLDEFLFLHDSTVVHRHEWIYEVMDAEGQSFALCTEGGPIGSYMGKYRRSVLDAIGGVPQVRNKYECIQQEHDFTLKYCQADKVHVLWPDLRSTHAIEKNGRVNAVMSNEHFTKYKATYGPQFAAHYEEIDRVASGREKREMRDRLKPSI